VTPIGLGRYRHFKGGIYTVLNSAISAETCAIMVVYRAEDGTIWVRPALEWDELVGDGVKRFERVA